MLNVRRAVKALVFVSILPSSLAHAANEWVDLVECKQADGSAYYLAWMGDEMILHTGNDATPDHFELFFNDGLSYGGYTNDLIMFQGYASLANDRATAIKVAVEHVGEYIVPRSLTFAPYSSLEPFNATTISCHGNTRVNMDSVRAIFAIEAE